jgi:pyruvate formate lyase activating enzyme
MRIGGFQRQSLIEFPGMISAVIFTVGCNLRCPFCHNFRLIEPGEVEEIPEEIVLDHLCRNRRLLDAVVVSGGEPTIQPDLKGFLQEVKSMGYAIKLETNGTEPDVLGDLIESELLDLVAMDVKAPPRFDRYNEVVGGILTPELFERMLESISILRESGIEHEFRTTLVPGLISQSDIEEIRRFLEGERHITQEYQSVGRRASGVMRSTHHAIRTTQNEEVER